MSDIESEQEIERLRTLVAQYNKSLRELESLYSELARAASEVIKWAEYNGAGYTIGRLPIDELREALKRLRSAMQ